MSSPNNGPKIFKAAAYGLNRQQFIQPSCSSPASGIFSWAPSTLCTPFWTLLKQEKADCDKRGFSSALRRQASRQQNSSRSFALFQALFSFEKRAFVPLCVTILLSQLGRGRTCLPPTCKAVGSSYKELLREWKKNKYCRVRQKRGCF